MKQVEVIFQSPDSSGDQLGMKWQVLPHFSAEVWFQKLLELTKLDRPLFYPRFTGFISRFKTMDQIGDLLNRAIDIVNSEGVYEIKERAPGEFNQEFSNLIHHHFEILLASQEKPSELFKKLSHDGKIAVQFLNHCIHDMEALHRSELQARSGQTSGAALTLEGRDVPRFRIPSEFEADFSLNNDFGDMVLHYSQIGKTWWEVFLDKDEHIHPNAILPLYAFSGEFDVFFEPFQISTQQKTELESFLRKKGRDPQDPKLRLGYLCVAKLIRGPEDSDRKVYGRIAEHLRVKEIRLYEDGNVCGSFLPDYKSISLAASS